MSTLSAPLPSRFVYPQGPVFRLTVGHYHEMIAAGILTPDDKVELPEGALICKMRHNPPHRTAVLRLQRTLPPLLPAATFPQFQLPITLADSEPEPDGAVILGAIEDFGERHPDATSVAWVTEVSDSTLTQDRSTKQRVYAAAGIAVYWIINLIDRSVEVYTRPTATAVDATYQGVCVFNAGDVIAVELGGRTIGELAVAELLP